MGVAITMTLTQVLTITIIAIIFSTVSGTKQCYQCGYQVAIVNGENGPQQPLPGYPFCGDHATQQDHKVECKGEDDCCGSIKEFVKITDTDTGESKELLVGRHDCQSALKEYAKYDVLCSEHTDECVDVAIDQLPEGHNNTIQRARICFCSGDLCNWHVPDIDTTPKPEETTQRSKQCYNCGYKSSPEWGVGPLPDLPYCQDFANPDDITINCLNTDDCCATVKEYFTRVDENTGENSTSVIMRHGCESDLNHIGEQTVLCSDHPDSCFNIDKSDLPDHTYTNVTVTDTEICFCDEDRCNNEAPATPTTPAIPTTPATPTSPATPTTSAIPTSTPLSGCSGDLSFSPGDIFPDSSITCYDTNYKSWTFFVPLTSSPTLVSPGTTCIFMGSGHLTEGLVMEMFCDGNIWTVNIVSA